jgi:predicted lipoprotein with Yx(FWY)xxD motif
MRTYALVLLAIAAAALLLAGCGGGGGTGGGHYGGGSGTTTGGEETHTPANGEAEESGNAYVALASSPGLGLILVNSEGLVLYAFDSDRGATSSCYGACAKSWPPLLTEGSPQPSNGASAANLGTSERKDGSTQVTYAGHPLYTFSGDGKPGEATGNGVSAFGGRWSALEGSGAPAG